VAVRTAFPGRRGARRGEVSWTCRRPLRRPAARGPHGADRGRGGGDGGGPGTRRRK